MAKHAVQVKFSGYFFQEYLVDATTQEEAEQLLRAAIKEEGWQEADAPEQIELLSRSKTEWEITGFLTFLRLDKAND
tara:strand:- start:502 stop:732 length:231 start_codon:yes stop_codon:yes gene_type:complete